MQTETITGEKKPIRQMFNSYNIRQLPSTYLFSQRNNEHGKKHSSSCTHLNRIKGKQTSILGVCVCEKTKPKCEKCIFLDFFLQLHIIWHNDYACVSSFAQTKQSSPENFSFVNDSACSRIISIQTNCICCTNSICIFMVDFLNKLLSNCIYLHLRCWSLFGKFLRSTKNQLTKRIWG